MNVRPLFWLAPLVLVGACRTATPVAPTPTTAEQYAEVLMDIVPPEIIADSGVDLNDALEFAHFLRLWVESWLAGPGVENVLDAEQISAVIWGATSINAFNRVSILSRYNVHPRP